MCTNEQDRGHLHTIATERGRMTGNFCEKFTRY